MSHKLNQKDPYRRQMLLSRRVNAGGSLNPNRLTEDKYGVVSLRKGGGSPRGKNPPSFMKVSNRNALLRRLHPLKAHMEPKVFTAVYQMIVSGMASRHILNDALKQKKA